ncbi:hypothetical protein NIES2135_58060 [Leptolyngbya boryana NIES-2135]|jgi:hypothetical protein|uniref:Uncharacterized protein n=1 Tax=Leptolyngbya boryana NIES-2135 TaxID=1973484 RepID=A0A1Z4JQ95_LEPBY|nr:hypothetical protein NIES2135_58060 [Leptolyngbya boryana NIES-2135]
MPVTRAARASTTPPTISNPPSNPTNEQLRTTSVAILDCLRNAGLVSNTISSRNTAQLDPLTYTPINNGSYTYHGTAYTMSALRDGSNTVGMMVTNASTVFVQVQFSTAVYLNQVQLWLGQFNGNFNHPRDLSIFAGAVTSTAGTPLYSGTLATVATVQTINLASDTDFNTAHTIYTFVFSNSTGGVNVSVGEMLIWGQAT